MIAEAIRQFKPTLRVNFVMVRYKRTITNFSLRLISGMKQAVCLITRRICLMNVEGKVEQTEVVIGFDHNAKMTITNFSLRLMSGIKQAVCLTTR